MANTLTTPPTKKGLDKMCNEINALMERTVKGLMKEGLSNKDACRFVAGILGCSINFEEDQID